MPKTSAKNHNGEITILLSRFRRGDTEAADQLLPIVYDRLRQLARSRLRSERSDHTLQPTELVHEAFMEMFGNEKIDWQDRQHFFIVASNQMRRLLVDYARAKLAAKRDGDRQRIELDEASASTPPLDTDVLALDQALNQLAADYPLAAQVVELRYFGGMTEKEAAEAFGISVSKLKREWDFAKAWLHRRLRSA